ncbi:MAG: glycosyltransferase family 4 protein [Acidobacteria bacterium]|nr:glycosyltransferase family 4 protein [Acidobacteriota bacterium]
MRVAVLCPDFPPDRSGLADHTAALAEHLAAHVEVIIITSQHQAGDEIEPLTRIRVLTQIPRWDWPGIQIVSRLLRQLEPDWLLVQYVPHMYGRGGVNLMLPLWLWWWRWRGGAVLLLIHELYIPWSLAPRRIFAAVAQRLMLVMSIAAARRVGVSTEVWHRKLERLFPFWRSRFHHLPTPSNIPVAQLSESERTSVRQQIGLASDELVLGYFGTLHDSKLMEYVMESLHRLETAGQRARLLCIGPASEELIQSLNGISHQWNDRVICTGYLESSRVSQYLSVTDIFLLPLIDGVSSRRSSLMAAFSHKVPIVATFGEGTDRTLLESAALALSPVEDESAFLENVCALAADETRRRQLGEAGGKLYQNQFGWPIVIRRLLSMLERR